jgi:hypothetical protein
MSDAIQIARGPDGSLTYAVPVTPDRLPPVAPRALLAAWDAARSAAAEERWGARRTLLFHRPDGEAIRIAIADPDAGCWAEAIDRETGLATLAGLALCLRLLALVELLTRAPWLASLFTITAEGIELHPALLGAAATMPLDAGARFDEAGLRRLLANRLPAALTPAE